MVEPRANLVSSLQLSPDAQAQICSSGPAARKMSERSTTCRDCIALGAGITPARQPHHSADGISYSEHGLAVHAFCPQRRNLTQKKVTEGVVTCFWW